MSRTMTKSEECDTKVISNPLAQDVLGTIVGNKQSIYRLDRLFLKVEKNAHATLSCFLNHSHFAQKKHTCHIWHVMHSSYRLPFKIPLNISFSCFVPSPTLEDHPTIHFTMFHWWVFYWGDWSPTTKNYRISQSLGDLNDHQDVFFFFCGMIQ